ncbi:MAG: hypothetical protein V3V08_20820 [Nannocystaceae bacterium]
MSRYVEVGFSPGVGSLDELHTALPLLDLRHDLGAHGRRIMLTGNLECAGRPVDVRFAAAALQTVEDFGLIDDGAGLQLVCGEFDHDLLRETFLPQLRQAIVRCRAETHAAATGATVECSAARDGTLRIRLRKG